VKSETFKTVFVQKSSEFVCYWTALRPISTDRDMFVTCLSVAMRQSEGVPVEEGVVQSRQAGLTASSPLYPPGMQASEDSRLCGSLYSDTSFASSFNPDNVSIERHPVILG